VSNLPQLPSYSLDGRIALVTGASSGLGFHFAKVLSAAGAKIALAARRADRLEALKQEIIAAGGDAIAVSMDVTARPSVDAGIAQVIESYGALDILVNNAGVADSHSFLGMPESAWHHTIDTNLTGAWRVAQECARAMVARGSGTIINISSIMGLGPVRRHANYAVAKAGVVHLTELMALELGRKGLRVNAIAPGFVLTELNDQWLESAEGEKFVATLFPRRLADASELDGALLLLASDMGSYINGVTIPVDGGTLLTME
jgi:NAD(P)-dependent dehydrogenase (short-subunit alcohol dehydrogenase family)